MSQTCTMHLMLSLPCTSPRYSPTSGRILPSSSTPVHDDVYEYDPFLGCCRVHESNRSWCNVDGGVRWFVSGDDLTVVLLVMDPPLPFGSFGTV